METTGKIKGRKLAVIILFLLAPVLGELLSGSSPPPEFFKPFGFVFMTILYGGGALLIREARVRWDLGWSIIFLAIAYGILEEGVMVQSFFNHHHEDLNSVARYGMFLGTQWPWAIGLTMYHGIISTTIPILIVDLLFPRLKNVTFLKKKGIVTIVVLLIVEVIMFSLMLNYEFGSIAEPYVPNVLMILIWTVITLCLIHLAYKYRVRRRIESRKKIRKPITFVLLAFVLQLLIIMFSSTMAENGVPAIVTVGLQLFLVFLLLLFVFRQIYNRDITVRHKTALVFGSLMPYILLSILYEYDFGEPMIEVGIVSFVLLLIFMIVVNRRGEMAEKR